jgi:hypothetical protein
VRREAPSAAFPLFTEDGLFGSLDKNGQQADDGTYEIVDTHTFSIGDSTFRYTVTGATRSCSNPSSHAHSAGRSSHRHRTSPPVLDGQRRVRGNDLEARAL